jgi:hypothetical protein
MNTTQEWRDEKRAQMLALLDNPRTGLKDSSDTNKTRRELVGMIDEIIDTHTAHLVERLEGLKLIEVAVSSEGLMWKQRINAKLDQAIDIVQGK